MATQVTVGGKDYQVQPLVFATLEKVWPRLEVVQAETKKHLEAQRGNKDAGPPDVVKMMNHAVAFIAMALLQDDPELQALIADEKYSGMNEDEKDKIVIAHVKGKITSVEVQELEPVIQQIMEEAGFKPQEGGDSGEPAAIPSTATGTHSSPSSSPQDAREEAGIE